MVKVTKYTVSDPELGVIMVINGELRFKSQSLNSGTPKLFDSHESAEMFVNSHHRKNAVIDSVEVDIESTCGICKNYSEPTNKSGICSLTDKECDAKTASCKDFILK